MATKHIHIDFVSTAKGESHTLDIVPNATKARGYDVTYTQHAQNKEVTTFPLKSEDLEEYVWLFVKTLLINKWIPNEVTIDIPGFPTIRSSNPAADPKQFDPTPLRTHIKSIFELLEAQEKWPVA